MLKQWLKVKAIFIVWMGLLLSTSVFAEIDNKEIDQLDQSQIISQQIELLKNRLVQAKNELTKLQHQQDKQLLTLPNESVNKQLLRQSSLDIAIGKSNLDSIEIEVSESEQTISRVDKHIQEIENQLNILNIFGKKLSDGAGTPSVTALQSELKYQKSFINLEKTRANYLEQLRDVAKSAVELNKIQFRHIEALLKSRSITRIKEEQAKSETNFQRQQTYWLAQLNDLYLQLSKAESAKKTNKTIISQLEGQIFFANESVNFTYLQMLISRYQDQLRQYKISIAHNTSIGILNNIDEQTQTLSKQLARVRDLLEKRIAILEKRKVFLTQDKSNATKNQVEGQGLTNLMVEYQAALTRVENLTQQIIFFRPVIDQALKQELSARQGLPEFGTQAWLDLGEEILWVPTLTYQVVKGLFHSSYHQLQVMHYQWKSFLVVLEVLWLTLIYFIYRFFTRAVLGMPDHESGHVNLKWFGIKLLQRNLLDIALVLNIGWMLALWDIPYQNFSFLINLGIVWVFLKFFLVAARLLLVETVHDSAGQDVKLYHHIKWLWGVGLVVTSLSVFLHELPVIYEVKDLFDRLFLLYLFVVSIFLLRSWDVVPNLIVPYLDAKRTYLKRILSLLGILMPLILLANTAIGLFGFVNFIQTISWYEIVFVLMLITYLIVRGLLIEGMEFISRVLIRHVTNGWLWTEAFLKPIDKVLRIAWFLMAWAILFLIYGWDQQSPVVERLSKLLDYPLLNILNTTITPLSVIEVLVLTSLLFWAAKWTREFVYRMLLSRTKDLGLRNSIAILSQYSMIVVGILICLGVLGIDFRALAVVASAFAFGVGLGLRDLFNNFACGFLLLLERPVRVGDTVTINNQEGDVIHIGSRAVTIRTWDHLELMVPNAEIFSKTFINWTGKDNIVRTVFSIKINLRDNPHAIQELIYTVLAEHKDVLKEPQPEVFIKEMSGGLLELEVRYYINIRQVRSRVGVKSEILADIWDMFAKHHIKPSFPQHEVVIAQNPPQFPEEG